MLLSVGHSNRTLEQLITILEVHHVDMVADVRGGRAGSKTFPHFNKENLSVSLPTRGIFYRHIPELGGRRPVNKEIDQYINSAWRVPAFKAYADYAYTSSQFDAGLRDLMEEGRYKRVAFMCSEAVPWRCHRSIITDYLVLVYNVPVLHLLSEKQTLESKPHSFSEKDGNKLRYPKSPTRSDVLQF